MNHYYNSTARKGIYVNVFACDQELDSSCESKDKVEFLFESIQVTFFLMQGRADLGNLKNYGKSPVKYFNSFVSQMSLNYDQYLGEKIFMRVNNLVTKDNRLNPFKPAEHS